MTPCVSMQEVSFLNLVAADLQWYSSVCKSSLGLIIITDGRIKRCITKHKLRKMTVALLKLSSSCSKFLQTGLWHKMYFAQVCAKYGHKIHVVHYCQISLWLFQASFPIFIMMNEMQQLNSHRSIIQSINFWQCQYLWWSHAQWHGSRFGVQQQNWWSSSITSTGHRVCWCQWGKGQVKEMSLRGFLKVATEVAEWTDSGRLFQREEVQEWNALAPALVLTLGNDTLNSFV